MTDNLAMDLDNPPESYEHLKRTAEFYRKMAEQKMDHAAELNFELVQAQAENLRLQAELDKARDCLKWALDYHQLNPNLTVVIELCKHLGITDV